MFAVSLTLQGNASAFLLSLVCQIMIVNVGRSLRPHSCRRKASFHLSHARSPLSVCRENVPESICERGWT